MHTWLVVKQTGPSCAAGTCCIQPTQYISLSHTHTHTQYHTHKIPHTHTHAGPPVQQAGAAAHRAGRWQPGCAHARTAHAHQCGTGRAGGWVSRRVHACAAHVYACMCVRAHGLRVCTVCVCDHGAVLPGSLPHSPHVMFSCALPTPHTVRPRSQSTIYDSMRWSFLLGT